MAVRNDPITSQARYLLKSTRVMNQRMPDVKAEFFNDEDRVWLCENVIELATQNKRLLRKINRRGNSESTDV